MYHITKEVDKNEIKIYVSAVIENTPNIFRIEYMRLMKRKKNNRRNYYENNR